MARFMTYKAPILIEEVTISIVLPSRSRPKRLKRLLESILVTTNDIEKIEVIVLLDSDDESNYTQRKFGKLNCSFLIGDPKRTMGTLNQECLSKATGQIIFFTNDDVIFRTTCWDTLLIRHISKIPDAIYLAYPNDLIKGPKLCTFPIMDRAFLLENLDIIPDCYRGSFIDLHIMDIFKAYRSGSRIIYIKDLICEHQHYRTDPILFDDTYKNRKRLGDDLRFIKLSSQRSYIVRRLEKKAPKLNSYQKNDTVFQLLTGSADLYWKLKLFSYMVARKAYKRLNIQSPFISKVKDYLE
jgi:glycosyltransferase involved in cell wall biosynthesis